MEEGAVGAVEAHLHPREGRSRGWPATGSGHHDQAMTVPEVETSTKSVVCSWVSGSNSGGGTSTRPDDVRPPTTTPSRRPVKKRPRTGPVDLV